MRFGVENLSQVKLENWEKFERTFEKLARLEAQLEYCGHNKCK